MRKCFSLPWRTCGEIPIYAKIFDSMYEGTLYGHWEAIVTLQQMLVLCDTNGVIDMTPEAISARTSIPLKIITKGIEILSSADPHSRTPGEDGKRIATIDQHRPWGWYIVNHAKYQKLKSIEEKREADRVRIAEKRKDNKNSHVAGSRGESQNVESVAEVAHADADADADVNLKPPLSPPSRKGRGKRTAKAPKAPETPIPADFEVFKEMAEWALAKGLSDQQIDDETERFIAKSKAKGWTHVDWEAAWRTWILNAIKFGLPVKPPAPPASAQLSLETP